MPKREKDSVKNSTNYLGKIIIPWGFQFHNNCYCMSGEIRIYNALKDLEESYLNSLNYIKENGCYNSSEIYTAIHNKCIDVIQNYANSLSEDVLKKNCSDMLNLRKKIFAESENNKTKIQALNDVFVVDETKYIGENLTEENIIIYNCDAITK